jgi:uncharacterized protein with PIN domain
LLDELGARQREKGVRWLFNRAEQNAGSLSRSQALTAQNILLDDKVCRFKARKRIKKHTGDLQFEPSGAGADHPILFCDAGLGGLARWLRAAGWDAHWVQDISDDDLVRGAESLHAIIITTDSLLLDRRIIVHGQVSAIWVPPSLTKLEQLKLVRAELRERLGFSEAHLHCTRCMRCGGALASISKEAVKERIPPKTFHWVDDYFECERCGQLFWEGTHWRRVTRELADGV